MNIILLQEQDFTSAAQIRISGLRASHITKVLRAGTGDRLKVGLLNHKLGSGVIIEVTSHSISMEVTLTDDAPPPSPVHLLLALPRPKALKRIIRSVAELGIKQLTLINAYRVEKSYWQSPTLLEQNIDQYLQQGLAQAGDTIMPEIRIEKRFKPFVEDRLPALAASRSAYVAHPGANDLQPPKTNGSTLLAIGPEGGFIPYEIAKLQAGGLQLMSLGARILRVETAVPYAIAQLTQGETTR